jgi:hypothetical protein
MQVANAQDALDGINEAAENAMKVKTDHLIPTLAGLSELAEKMAEHKEALVELMEFLQAVHDTFE